jgi:hypothetical protein
MSEEYIRRLFEIMDGKVSYSNVDQKKRGRKPGYKHSQETKDKIAEQMRDRIKDEETKAKISRSLQGVPKPLPVRRKISRKKRQLKNSIASDFLNQYSGAKKERDVSLPSADYLDKCGYSKAEACTWIKEHYDELNTYEYKPFDNECGDICSESRLNEGLYKGSVIDNDGFMSEDWREHE